MAWADGEGEPFMLAGLGPRRRAGRSGHRAPTASAGKATDCDVLRQPATTSETGAARVVDASPATATSATSTPTGHPRRVRDATDDGRVLGITEIDDIDRHRARPCSTRRRPARRRCWTPATTLSTRSRRTASYVLASDTVRRRHRLRPDRGVRRPDGDLLADRMNRQPGPGVLQRRGLGGRDPRPVHRVPGRQVVDRPDGRRRRDGVRHRAAAGRRDGKSPGTSRPADRLIAG